MKYLKLYFKNLLIPFLLIIIGNLVITILSYFGLISGVVSIFQIVLVSIMFLIGGYKMALKGSKKGYIDGLYFSLITIFILFILNIIFIHNFSFKNIYFYIILIISSMIGGMISNIKGSRN